MGTLLLGMGAAIAAIAGIMAIAGLFWLAGTLIVWSATRLLKSGLFFIRVSNWIYWNQRMKKEGIVSMQRFYREQVALRKPKSMQDFKDVDHETQRADAGEPQNAS